MKLIKNTLGICYNPKKISHNIMFIFVAAIMILQCFLMDIHDGVLKEYPQDISAESQYVKQMDAFLKGQLYLDIEADPRLKELENPYSPEQRDEAGVSFYWDHTYFEGKYYSYFGVAPILTVYLPCYLISGKVPDQAYVCLVLAIEAIIFMSFAVREAVIWFCKKVNLWLFLLSIAAVISVSGVYMSILCSDVYYIPVVSALGCSMAYIFFALSGIREENGIARNVYFALSAVALTLTVLSRPTVAIICAAFLPVILSAPYRYGRKNGVSAICSFAAPLAFGAAAVMWYNAARFGSVFDFGAAYQLTVCDVGGNELQESFAFSALFSYFLHPMWQTETELGIGLSGQLVLPPEARYVYGDIYSGAFSFWLPTACLLYRRNIEQETQKDIGNGRCCIIKHVTVISVCALACAIAFFDFCYAGVNMRYIYDIVPALSVVGAFILLDMQARCIKNKKIMMSIVCALFFILAIRSGMNIVEIFKSRM